MSNRRCAAKTCFNTHGCRPNLKFFNFPKDKDQCHQWVVNCDRKDLFDKPLEQINKFVLCADHFERFWFLNPKYKTTFIRNAQPIPTIFYNNLADFVPKSLKKNFAQKNKILQPGERPESFKDSESYTKNSVQNIADFLSASGDDYTVEIKIDPDSIEDPAAIRGCHKMCRLCAHLVYEYKLIPVFGTTDKSQCLASKINQFLPEKISEGDGLPQHVCNSCVKKLNECDVVIQAFIIADTKLRCLFQMQNSVPQVQEEEIVQNEIEDSKASKLKVINSELPPDLAEFLTAREDESTNSHEDPEGDILQEQSRLEEEHFDEKSCELPDPEILRSEVDAVQESGELSPEEILGMDVEVEDSYDTAVPCIMTQNEQVMQVKIEECWTLSADDSNDCEDISDGLPDMKVYKCSICQLEFSERNKLLIHEISEHVFEDKEEKQISVPFVQTKIRKEQATCEVCGKVFSGKKTLRRHAKEHAAEEYVCEFCGMSYKSKGQLDLHRRTHTDDKPFTCADCEVKFHNKRDLYHHRRSRHCDIKTLTCTTCDKICPNRNALWRHQKTHSNDRNMLCYLCGKVLSNSQSMRVHMRTHSNARPCSCPHCGRSFKDSTSVNKHMLMHSATKNFECDICGRAFYSKALVKQHKLSHSGVKPHKCEMCGAAYNRLGNLNQHKKKHVGILEPIEDLTHECVACGKKMRSELTLKYHLAKHTGEKKPFDCEVCGKRFIAVDPYRVHMRIHTGERPYQCTTCNKTFRSAFTLKQHCALHRDECPYPCPFCERKFKRLQSLIVHKRTHTGEKPHRCPLCGRAFAQKGDMLKHMKTHNRDRPATANKMKVDKSDMEMEPISDLALSDTEITSEFLIDMPMVGVETEIQSEMQSDIKNESFLS